jgi:hypothetical protein
MSKDVAALYHEHYVSTSFERLEMFKLLAQHYGEGRVLYAGSFAHVTPSFVFPSVVYVDEDKQARRFFADSTLPAFIAEHKTYPQDASVIFHAADYRQGFPEPDANFDLLISQYAGFVGHYCKRYLKVGGVLVANDSHGDASIALLDSDYVFDAVLTHRGERYCLTHHGLEAYFVPKPKSKTEITPAYLFKHQRSPGYVKTANAYVFRRMR